MEIGQSVLIKNESIFLASEQETEMLGKKIAEHIQSPAIIFLEGILGAGKTTLVRGFLRALGYHGYVKSPTFTLVETYELPNSVVAHFDLYRLTSPNELHSIGFRDYVDENTICLIEWAEKARDILPPPTLLCKLKMLTEKEGRAAELQWMTE